MLLSLLKGKLGGKQKIKIMMKTSSWWKNILTFIHAKNKNIFYGLDQKY
jgi:hypothetical protein